MKKQDLVSIIIPTYNRELYYISRAVKSIQQQTYKHYEIIIVDDNTDTSTYSLQIKKYCKSNGILYLKTDGKQGANVARNIGAFNSHGTYLAFLDDDDLWIKNKLEIQLAYFRKSEIGMVYSNGYIISNSSRKLYTCPQNFVTNGNMYKLLLYNYIGPTVTALIRRDCFFHVGMFDETLPAKQDYDLWIRIVKNYQVIGINRPLFIYTRHQSNQITKNYNSLLDGYIQIYKKYYGQLQNDFIYNFFFYLKVSFIYKKKREYFKSFCLLIKAISNIKYAKLKIVF